MASADVWVAIKAEYSTGKQPAELSGRFGVAAKTISNRASLEGWKVDREAVGKIVAARTTDAVAARLVATVADYVAQHTDDWQALRHAIMAVLEADFDNLNEDQIEAIKAKAAFALAATKAYKEVQIGQRLSLGITADTPTQATTDEQPTDYSKYTDAELADIHLSEARRSQGSGQ